MAAYATKHWKNYNPAYPNYSGQGASGDCTNFVSHSLKAGGWKHVPDYTYDWHKWFGTADIQSDSFVGVNEFSLVRPLLPPGHNPRQRLPDGHR